MLTGIARLRQLVDEHPDRRHQTLIHYVNAKTLKEAHKEQATGKASGVDGKTKETYGIELESNIGNLLERMKSFSYHPQPVKRGYIEKEGKNELRPLGIPTVTS